ncbi:glycosyltransferase family 4 protein [Pontibacter sp. BT310]|uniref:Glycosyltransferase family 4 protein n=1 Tax=Pontibacter populi TaxID=890055 RepID=A0ABS6X8X0_9BACT|nr:MULTISPECIES: glycosyltransferase family 4 protein [Pontibacter]MBJ6117251.1 glycosyltransferase family 4 protein [Pontibacter sp. BT310]MBR0569676.1 glycosyltransferase family 4 protein [Microvirga sp. STS03]MBW3364104.1 glycosyltransferase family 4 protein [Pontibacter populi]
MRILQLVSERSWRGGEQQVAYLLEELRRLGITCHICCRKGSAFEEYCKQNDFPYIALPFTKVFPIPTALQLKNYINKHQIQLVHMQASHAHTIGVLAHMLGANCDLVLSRRVEFPIGSSFLSNYKYNYKGIKRIICISERVREVLAQSIEDGSKCVTVYSGINLDRFKDLPATKTNYLRRTYHIPEDKLLIGNISAIDVHKDYFTYLETAKLLKEQGVKAIYLAIGTGKLEQEVKKYAADIGLSDDVVFTGFIKNVHQVMPELDMFIFTTIKEGLGTTVLDAFACRVPVVASATGGIPEMVEDGVTGMLAPIKQPAVFAEKALLLIQQPVLRESIVANASQKVLKFSKEETALHTLAIYKDIMSIH